MRAVDTLWTKWRAREARRGWDANQRTGQGGEPSVIFIGDSITEQWMDRDPDAFRPGWLNMGIGGETTVEILARFDRDVVAYRPQAVHIMAGTNDLWHGHAGVGAARALDNIADMVRKARAAGIAVILAPPPPVGENIIDDFRTPELFAPLRAGIATIARDQGLVHVDYASSLTDSTGRLLPERTTDGVHISRKGYLAMRKQAEDAVDDAGVEAPPAGRFARYRKPAIIGGAVLAFLALVILLVPPTKPMGGAQIDLNNQQGFAPVVENATDYRSIAARTHTAADDVVEQRPDTNDQASDPAEDEAPAAGDESVNSGQPYAATGEDDERGFSIGYRWAQRADLTRKQDCRVLQTPAREAGCRSYIRDGE